MSIPIQIIKGDDGILAVEYFGKLTGWIAKAKGERFKYRALSVYGQIGYFNSINSAKCFVISNYH